MRDNQKPFEYGAPPVTPEAIPGRLKHAPKPSLVPRGLFSRIIRRLGLEKQLLMVRKNLGLFAGVAALFIVLLVFAVIGFKHVLAESSFGPFVSLIFSDPDIVVKYWHSFVLSVFESVPDLSIVAILLATAFLMFFVRLASAYFQKFMSLAKTIRKEKHAHVK